LIQHQSSLRSHLSGLRFNNHEVGSYQFFSNIQNTNKNLESTSTTFSADSDSDYTNIGFTYRQNENWTLGAAIAYVDQDVDVDATGTEFENDGFLFSGLATYQKGNLFAEAGITLSSLDVESNRGVLLGITQRIESGSSDANALGVTLALGQNAVKSDKWRAGPIFRLDYNKVDVESFSENGTNSTSLSFSNIERASLIAGAGMFANYDSSIGSIPIQYFGEALIEGDLESAQQGVQASVNSLANSPEFSLESFDTDSVGYSLQLGASARITNNINAQLSYTYQDLAGDINSINFGISSKF